MSDLTFEEQIEQGDVEIPSELPVLPPRRRLQCRLQDARALLVRPSETTGRHVGENTSV